jgi:hypothetical protein
MNLQAYLKGLKRSSKTEDIPGTVEAYLDELCPVCSKKLKIMKPCCSEKRRSKVCGVCDWKSYLE